MPEDLGQNQFDSVIISRYRSVPEMTAGFILQKTGVISSENSLYNPMVWYSREMDTRVKGNSLLLFREEALNPTLLAKVINDRKRGLSYTARTELLTLANFLQRYRSYKGGRWVEARSHIQDRGTANELRLHDFLSSIVDANFIDPQIAFRRGVEALNRLYCRDTGFNIADFDPVEFEVPILKNEGDKPDIVDLATFSFDRTRVIYLVGRHFPIVIGGAPNSGKSTFAVSLFEAMDSLIQECEVDGILGDREVRVDIFDLDKISPTARSIEFGKQPIRGSTRIWNENMARELLEGFETATLRNTVILGDLPGGVPDIYTDILAGSARFSILVTRAFGEEAQDWRRFFTSLDNQVNIIRVHTKFGEPDRISGVRNYSVLRTGSRRDLLWGRVVDLDRKAKSEDNFIMFAARALLFEYLPEAVISEFSAHHGVHNSLKDRHYPKKE